MSESKTPRTDQCEICLDAPPYTKCAGAEAPESASCAYISSLELALAERDELLRDLLDKADLSASFQQRISLVLGEKK